MYYIAIIDRISYNYQAATEEARRTRSNACHARMRLHREIISQFPMTFHSSGYVETVLVTVREN